jgi:hypothetical protein
MPGLDPGIHLKIEYREVDRRIKSGDDDKDLEF